jgi:hypothetical protein
MLISILRDESAEPTTLDLSLLEDMTNKFSTEQEIDQGEFGMVYKVTLILSHKLINIMYQGFTQILVFILTQVSINRESLEMELLP